MFKNTLFIFSMFVMSSHLNFGSDRRDDGMDNFGKHTKHMPALPERRTQPGALLNSMLVHGALGHRFAKFSSILPEKVLDYSPIEVFDVIALSPTSPNFTIHIKRKPEQK
jgi:hypothetical protein